MTPSPICLTDKDKDVPVSPDTDQQQRERGRLPKPDASKAADSSQRRNSGATAGSKRPDRSSLHPLTDQRGS